MIRTRMAILTLLLVGLTSAGCRSAPPSESQRNRAFSESMRGVTMAGWFSIDGKEGVSKDSYAVESVTHVAGDTWMFRAKIGFGSQNVAIPVPVTMKWAGDTPVIMVTDLTIPGMGTYTARVVIYGDRYAGTWKGGDHGGAMFGRIERGSRR